MGMPMGGPQPMGMPGPQSMGMPGPQPMGMPGPQPMGMPGPQPVAMPQPQMDRQSQVPPVAPQGADLLPQLLEEAMSESQKGRKPQALAKYREALKIDPANSEALSWVEEHLRQKRMYADLRDVLLAGLLVAPIDLADLLPRLDGRLDVAELRLAEARHVAELRLARLDGHARHARGREQDVAEVGVHALLAQVLLDPREGLGVRRIDLEDLAVLGERLGFAALLRLGHRLFEEAGELVHRAALARERAHIRA
jgi:tetratricopeptide (TPR) repeat protein